MMTFFYMKLSSLAIQLTKLNRINFIDFSSRGLELKRLITNISHLVKMLFKNKLCYVRSAKISEAYFCF